MRRVLYALSAVSMAALCGCVEEQPYVESAAVEAALAAAPGQSMDDFAAQILDSVQERSFRENREYCGAILRTPNGRLIATPPRPGKAYSCEIIWPDDLQAVASYHTHGGSTRDADDEVPSPGDLSSDMEDNTVGYVATPGGRLWRTDPKAGVAELFCASGCVRRDPDYIDCANRAVGARYTLAQLYARTKTPLGICPKPS